MTEEEFQKQAEAECDRLGLLWHHCAQPRRCRGPIGFPDLVIAGPGGLLLAELKRRRRAERGTGALALDGRSGKRRPGLSLPAVVPRRQ